MDGLLLNTEDLYTDCTNHMLHKYGRPSLPWHIKAQLQGRPGPAAGKIFQDWAQLPIPTEQYRAEVSAMQQELFPTSKPLPGVAKLLADLSTSNVQIALATSSHRENFELKIQRQREMMNVFEEKRRILGDDPRIKIGRGKPAPDIYLLALRMINETLPPNTTPIKPAECLVFEDSVPGVESGRRAGMRVVWCPHPELYDFFKDRREQVLAGRADEKTSQPLLGENPEDDRPGEIGDGWSQYLETLENFPYDEYDIVLNEKKAGQKL